MDMMELGLTAKSPPESLLGELCSAGNIAYLVDLNYHVLKVVPNGSNTRELEKNMSHPKFSVRR